MTMKRYSALSVFAAALAGNKTWPRAWRDAAPRSDYDFIVVGGGGHGLAAAYYLAKEHRAKRVAVLERGVVGHGSVGRNTTIIRSNYMMPGNALFYERALQMWERFSRELNFNAMVSQRGIYNLCHSPAQLDAARRRGNIMRANGIDAELFGLSELRKRLPEVDLSEQARFPVVGALHQPRAGTVRHDAVAWGYARAASALGVDIVRNCEVTGFIKEAGAVVGVETTRGEIRGERIGMSVAGHSGELAAKAGLRLPIESHLLQAFVSEPVKPLVDSVVTSGAAHLYVSQSDKGGLVFGGDLDGFNSYAARGGLCRVQDVASALSALVPRASRLRIVRHWGGVMDMSMDGSPFICKTALPGLYLNAGWCYGGFKATPAAGWCLAWTMAKDAPHELNAAFGLDRFARGIQIDEKGMGPFPGLH